MKLTRNKTMIKYLNNKELKIIFLSKKGIWIGLIIIGLIIKLVAFPIRLGDYNEFLEPWVNFIKAHGYSDSLKYNFYNYTPSYIYILIGIAKLGFYPLYSIKIVSILFEYLLAFYIGKIAWLKYKSNLVFWISFAVVPLLPTLLLNGAVWGQCDSIYSAFVVGSIYYIFKKKQFLSVLFLGLALAFKIQAIFILPVYFVLILRREIKWYYFLLVPVIYFLSILPTWLYGRPFSELSTIYLSQSNYYKSLTTFFPNVYIWLNDDFYDLKKLFGLIFTILFTIIIGVLFSRKKYNFNFETWIKLAFLSVIIMPFILPGMRERYLYLGDVFAVMYFFHFPKKIGISLGILFVSFYAYISCSRFKEFLPLWPSFFIYSGIIFLAVKDFVITINNSKDNNFK